MGWRPFSAPAGQRGGECALFCTERVHYFVPSVCTLLYGACGPGMLVWAGSWYELFKCVTQYQVGKSCTESCCTWY